MIEEAMRVVAEAASLPVDAEHVTWFSWLLDHAHEEVGLLSGGFVAYFLHTLYHRVWHRPTQFLMRRIFRRRKP
jgi:hypothetical protein